MYAGTVLTVPQTSPLIRMPWRSACGDASQNDTELYVMINSFWPELTFVVQEGHPDDWQRVVDTSLPSPDDFCEPGAEQPVQSFTYKVGPRSTVVLIRKRSWDTVGRATRWQSPKSPRKGNRSP
jgi:pullulanase/glycogen debranching enzyme